MEEKTPFFVTYTANLMDELDQEVLNFHITQYAIYGHRLHYKINGCHLYDSELERKYLEDMQEHHALQYWEMTSSDGLLSYIQALQINS